MGRKGIIEVGVLWMSETLELPTQSVNATTAKVLSDVLPVSWHVNH